MRILKPVVYLLAAIGLAFVALNLYLSSGLMRSCDVTSLTTVMSPDGQRQARLRIQTCNDESSPMVTLSISKQSAPKVEHATKIGVATSTELDLTWLSNEDLKLSYPESFVPASTGPFLDGVELHFSPKKIVHD